MKPIQLIIVLIALAVPGVGATRASAADEDGVAIAIVYDTSGSMKELVKDSTGKAAPKYVSANRALEGIANQIQAFATNNAAGGPRKVQVGLFVFRKDGPHAAIPMGPFSATALTTWARDFTAPNGGTPLGNTLSAAGNAVLKSGLTRRHVLVITDGVNTIGPDPATTLHKLQQDAAQKETRLGVHFVAFDVDAKVFAGVKKLGATVVGASNESQLNKQLEFILEKKILLEDEEAPKPK